MDHALVDADLHLTVSMGPSLTNALVSGHIFLVEVTCPETGQTIVRKMDNPEEQRSIVRPGLDRVAEEFWATSEPRGSSTPILNDEQQDSQQHVRERRRGERRRGERR
jgi:hypothetical protein